MLLKLDRVCMLVWYFLGKLLRWASIFRNVFWVETWWQSNWFYLSPLRIRRFPGEDQFCSNSWSSSCSREGSGLQSRLWNQCLMWKKWLKIRIAWQTRAESKIDWAFQQNKINILPRIKPENTVLIYNHSVHVCSALTLVITAKIYVISVSGLNIMMCLDWFIKLRWVRCTIHHQIKKKPQPLSTLFTQGNSIILDQILRKWAHSELFGGFLLKKGCYLYNETILIFLFRLGCVLMCMNENGLKSCVCLNSRLLHSQ